MNRIALAAGAVLLLAAAAFADGVIVPGRAVVKPVRTPDQRALLAFDGTTETLVVETTLQGEGRDFAWIVPLPAAPKIEESTAGLFPTLEVTCGPDVTWHDSRLWLVIPMLGLAALAVARGRRSRRPVPEYALVAALFVAIGTTVAITVPTMQESTPPGSGAVHVLSRDSVGAFDTATLAARDAASLRTWLDENGFRAPESIDSVADGYAKRGWVFVASKVRRDADDGEVRRVRPLVFTFPAASAVYPMQLTGAGNDSLALELFVAGTSQAQARGLVVETCEPHFGETGPLEHGELARRTAGAKCLTKLVGTLDRDAMREDVAVTWTDATRVRGEYVSATVARSVAADCALAALFTVLVLHEIRRSKWTRRRRLTTALVVALAAGGAGWWLAPRLPSGSWEIPHRRDRVAIDWSREPHEAFTDVAAARTWIASRTEGLVNPYSGEPLREEDSPGNWTLRDVDGKVELSVFDASRWEPMEWTLNLSSSKPGDTSNVRSSRTFALEGVVRGEDSAPVPRVHVRVIGADPRTAGRDREWLHGARETATDSSGHFRFEGLADEKWDVALDDDHHAMALVEDVDPRKLDAPLALVLPDGVALRGKVVGADGKPVARASVSSQPETPFMCPKGRFVVTDAEGAFALPGFAAGSKDVEVQVTVHVADGPDRSTKFTATPGGEPVEFRLDAR